MTTQTKKTLVLLAHGSSYDEIVANVHDALEQFKAHEPWDQNNCSADEFEFQLCEHIEHLADLPARFSTEVLDGRKMVIDEIEELVNEREEYYAPLLIDLTTREYKRIEVLRSLIRRLRKGPR